MAIDSRTVFEREPPQRPGQVCQAEVLAGCCERHQWEIWYPLIPEQSLASRANTLALGFFVESFLIDEPAAPSSSRSMHPTQWLADYGCLDTRKQDAFEAEVTPFEKQYLLRSVQPYVFACPPRFAMLATKPEPAKWNASVSIQNAKCVEVEDEETEEDSVEVQDTFESEDEDMKQPIRKDLQDCISTTVDNESMTRIEVAVTRPKVSGGVYAEAKIPEKAQWVSLSDEGTGVELKHKVTVGGLVFAGALLYHTYMACARAPRYKDIVLSIGARPNKLPGRIS